jgi:hypothetical protein
VVSVSDSQEVQDDAPLEKDDAPLEKDDAPLEKDDAPLEKDDAPLEKDDNEKGERFVTLYSYKFTLLTVFLSFNSGTKKRYWYIIVYARYGTRKV